MDLLLCNWDYWIDNVIISELYMMRIIIYNKIYNTRGSLFIHLAMCS